LRLLAFVAVLALVLSCSAAVLAAQYAPGGDDFESYDVGTYFTTITTSPPSPASSVWGDSATYAAGLRWNIVETAALDGNPNNKVVRIVDTPDSTTKNTHLRADFFPSAPYMTSGTYTVTMDVMPLQTNGPFKITMTRGASWTNGTDWVCAIGFGSTGGNTFFPDIASAGNRIFLQKVTVKTAGKVAWTETGVTYDANTWYTVKFVISVDTKTYRAYFGPHGGTLSELTSGPTAFIVNNTGVMVNSFGGMIVATSNIANEGAQLLLDNIVGPAPLGARVVWDTFTRADNWQLGTTEDGAHYGWGNGYNSVASITGNKMVFGLWDPPVGSDGAELQGYAASAVDMSAWVSSSGGDGAGIAYRKDSSKELGNPGFGYRLFWRQDGTSVKLSYQSYGIDYASTTYTPATAIDWTVPHFIRIKAIGSSHQVWLDDQRIIDWNDSHSMAAGDIIFYRVNSAFTVDDFTVYDTSVSATDIAGIKNVPVGVPVSLSSATNTCVTAAFSGFFYLEDANGIAGIKVVSPAGSPGIGDIVSVSGTLAENDGEKYINAPSFTVDGSADFRCKPWAVTGRTHAGPGLSDMALLMRIWGKVTWVSPDGSYFFVDDGSGVVYEAGKSGVKVINADLLVTPAVGDYVGCNGVASMDNGVKAIRLPNSWLYMDILKPVSP